MAHYIMTGQQLLAPNDPLARLPLNQLIHDIKNPSAALKQLIALLRQQQEIDPALYKQSKRRLPYFVNALFHPPVRKKDYFSAITSFTIDLDRLHTIGTTPSDIKNKLKNNPLIRAAFESPGGDGLKIIFTLSQRCTDSNIFTAFYKAFAAGFAIQYGLQSIIDLRTHDVTRACFLCADPHIFVNEAALAVNLYDYVNTRSPEEFHQSLEENNQKIETIKQQQPDTDAHEPDDEILQKISAKLNPGYKPKPAKNYYIPPRVDQVLPQLKDHLARFDIDLIHTAPINYGRKIRVKAGAFFAELNIFYGKNGFRIVITPKSGTNQQLAALAHQILSELIEGVL